jgi:hypothetical protein
VAADPLPDPAVAGDAAGEGRETARVKQLCGEDVQRRRVTRNI